MMFQLSGFQRRDLSGWFRIQRLRPGGWLCIDSIWRLRGLVPRVCALFRFSCFGAIVLRLMLAFETPIVIELKLSAALLTNTLQQMTLSYGIYRHRTTETTIVLGSKHPEILGGLQHDEEVANSHHGNSWMLANMSLLSKY